MSWATVTSKGQVTIPAEVRRALGLRRGSKLNFVRRSDGVFEIVPARVSILDFAGVVPAPAEPVTLEQMEEAIADGAIESSGLYDS